MKRSAYEWVLIFIVVVLTVVLGVGLYSGRQKVTKSKILIQELAMIRSGISHYRIVNKEVPASLEILLASTYDSGGEQRGFLDRTMRSEKGQVIDPFGNPYTYDQKRGWISSTTPGFEKW